MRIQKQSSNKALLNLALKKLWSFPTPVSFLCWPLLWGQHELQLSYCHRYHHVFKTCWSLPTSQLKGQLLLRRLKASSGNTDIRLAFPKVQEYSFLLEARQLHSFCHSILRISNSWLFLFKRNNCQYINLLCLKRKKFLFQNSTH